MTALARTVWFESKGVARVREEPLGEPGPGELVVRALASGVSAGTERLVLLGEVPEELRASMRLPSTRGSFELPIAYGYASVGEVEGRRVFAMAPHADRFVANASELRDLEPTIPAARATLAANLETAITATWDARIGLGDRVVVAGLGTVGLLVARLARRAGASSIVAIDRSASRRAIAEALGVEAIGELDAGLVRDADAIVEASGSTELLDAIVRNVGFEARVAIVSWYGAKTAPLALGRAFHPARATLRSSQVGAIPAEKRARWDHARRFDLVRELLRDEALDRLIAPPVPLADAPRLYAAIARGDDLGAPHVVFDAL